MLNFILKNSTEIIYNYFSEERVTKIQAVHTPGDLKGPADSGPQSMRTPCHHIAFSLLFQACAANTASALELAVRACRFRPEWLLWR